MPTLSKAAKAYLASRDARLREINGRLPGEPIPPAADGEGLAKVLNRSAAGRKAQRAGEEFEGRCITWAKHFGIELFKIPSGVKYLRGGDMAGIQTPFDFAGANRLYGGRCIVFDAKSVAATDKHQSFSIGAPIVKPHQVTALQRMGASGAVAGLLVNCGPKGDIRWLDWRILRYGDAIPFEDERWQIVSPIADPIDFSALFAIKLPGGGNA
jgi:hypothetical protein